MASPKKLSHIVLQTNRRREMIDWYCTVLGAEVLYEAERISFISYDDEHHRVAFLDPGPLTERQPNAAGLNHVAFTFAGLDDLTDSYLRLKEHEITPALCLDHGMTLSYYYADPDGNHVELQADCFGDWKKSTDWMRTSDEFKANPIGSFVDPDRIAADHADGMTFEQIHAKAMAGGYAPEQAPVEIPEVAS